MKAIERISFSAFVLLVLALGTYGQQKSELKVGDQIPNLEIQHIINRSSDKIILKELYKNGLLLIDFWFTSCVPCIKEMKLLDSLKSKHPGKFNVLMVTYEDSVQIQSFLSRPSSRDIKTGNLVLAVKDTLIHKLFPHRVSPHNIWVDSTGTIRAITGTEEVNEQNILGFGKSLRAEKLKIKKDLMNFNDLEEFHLMDTSFSYRSIITPRIPTLTGGTFGGTSKGLAYKRFFQYNASIAHLFWSAYSMYSRRPFGNYKAHMVELHTRDSLRLIYPYGKQASLLTGSKYKNMTEWNEDNIFCYALTLPERVTDTIFRNYMMNDLERQFHIKAKIENRYILCHVVKKTKGEPLLKSNPDAGDYSRIKFANSTLSIRNATIQDVVNYISTAFDNRILNDPFVVEIAKSVDFRFDLDLDLSALQDTEEEISPEAYFKLLGKYGYQFKKEKRPYPILVLHDLN